MIKVNNLYIFISVLTISISIIFSGCELKKKRPPVTRQTVLEQLHPAGLPQFEDDLNYDKLNDSILQSVEYLQRISAGRKFVFGKNHFSTDYMIKSLDFFLKFIQTRPPGYQLTEFIKKNYDVYRSIGNRTSGQVLFTGYYEPLLEGSLTPTPEFRYAVYARPNDLVTIDLSLFSSEFKGKRINGRYDSQTVVPYYDRREIETLGVLEETAESLAWVNDPVDLFFLQVQGSGKILLETGDTINIHYAAANGRPYKSIGKLMIDEGKIDKSKMSMQKIKAYLEQHPEERERIFNYNPSYVFFKTEDEGPLGCLNVPLTAGRSIATDRRIFPDAALAFIHTRKPIVDKSGQIQQWIEFGRFVLNQDTGGAIRGPGRADLFWGNGSYAETAAGHMQHTGDLYFLILKPEV